MSQEILDSMCARNVYVTRHEAIALYPQTDSEEGEVTVKNTAISFLVLLATLSACVSETPADWPSDAEADVSETADLSTTPRHPLPIACRTASGAAFGTYMSGYCWVWDRDGDYWLYSRSLENWVYQTISAKNYVTEDCTGDAYVFDMAKAEALVRYDSQFYRVKKDPPRVTLRSYTVAGRCEPYTESRFAISVAEFSNPASLYVRKVSPPVSLPTEKLYLRP